jgi:hypothetical protein
MDDEYYKDAFKMLRLANIGARKAQEENRRLGLPSVYFIDGKPIYVLPDGSVKTEYQY